MVSTRSVTRMLGWGLGLLVVLLLGAMFVVPAAGNLLVFGAVAAVLAALVVTAPFLPIGPLLVVLLLARTLTDNSEEGSRQTADLNPSVAIAAALLVLAVGVALGPRGGVRALILPALAVVAWTVLSVVNDGTDTVVWREGVRELSILAVAVLGVAAARRWKHPWTISHLILAIVAIPAALAIVQFATKTGMLVAGDTRAYGTFSHPNAAAPVFGVALLLCIVLLDGPGGLRYLVLGAFYAVALVGTGSLTGFAATIAMLLCYAMLRRGSLGRKLSILLLAVIIVTVFLVSPLGQTRLAEQTNFSLDAYGDKDAADTSLSWRLYNWSTLLSELGKSPIIGYGLGSTTTGQTATGTIPHNEYVRYLYETGVVGFVFFLVGLFLVIRALWRRYRQGGAEAPQALAALCIVVGLVVHAVSANTVLSTVLMYIVALLIGGGLARERPQKANRHGRTDHRPADRPAEAGSRRSRHLHPGAGAILPFGYPTTNRWS